MYLDQTSRIISTYSADVFGVCSALFELGGMTIMHDASGCNSTYTTHDEPRWYDMDSMVYISGLSEMDAVMGDDEKLIGDIAAAAEELKPKFIAVAGTPIPAMTGFDFEAVAAMVEDRTGIPAFGFPTTGMHSYVRGASMAFSAIGRRFLNRDARKTPDKTVNILGLTPLDFSVNGSDRSIAAFLEDAGYRVLSRWAMGSTLEELAQAGGAHVNLVVSAAGMGAAKVMRERFGIPFVAGVPVGGFREEIAEALHRAVETGENQYPYGSLQDGEIVVIVEAVTSVSLASALELAAGRGVRVLCPVETEGYPLREKDMAVASEAEIEEQIRDARMVIADPLYRPICPAEATFVPLPAEAFSGRIWREEIPDLVSCFDQFVRKVMV